MDLRPDAALEAGKIRQQEGVGEFAGAVGAEIEAQHHVAIAHPLMVWLGKHHRRHELVGLVVEPVAIRHRLAGQHVAPFPLAQHDGVPSELDAVPALVAVHRVIAADDRGDAGAALGGLILDFGQIGLAAGGRGVAAIGERVDEDVAHAGLLGELDHGDELVLMTVNAAIGHQADEMEASAAGLLEGLDKNRVGGQRAVLDGLVDAREVLIDNASSAEIEVADFRIAHLAGGQADVQAGGAEETFRVLLQHHVMKWRAGQQHGIAVFDCRWFSPGVHTPAVANDKHHWFLCHNGQPCSPRRDPRQA